MIGIDFDNTLVHVNNNNNYDIMPEVQEYLPLLYKKGFRFSIITGRNDCDKQFVRNVATDLENKMNIVFDNIFLTNDFPTKGSIAKSLGCKYLIDDKYSYLSDCKINDVIPIFLNHKNKNIVTKKKNVLYSWKQVYELLTNDKLL
ncbi:hypothetical protein Catovirus_2_53 [Catovirus CTV1]|uniref:Uncharacterized protein n=1 Tax=Catovirus CTV1 TaxID=1977631 RepID=A0A1V0SBQ4_9VIRU|nr:hypothetical protein Catovirus_2_53 [Catovirus CTV1]